MLAPGQLCMEGLGTDGNGNWEVSNSRAAGVPCFDQQLVAVVWQRSAPLPAPSGAQLSCHRVLAPHKLPWERKSLFLAKQRALLGLWGGTHRGVFCTLGVRIPKVRRNTQMGQAGLQLQLGVFFCGSKTLLGLLWVARRLQQPPMFGQTYGNQEEQPCSLAGPTPGLGSFWKPGNLLAVYYSMGLLGLNFQPCPSPQVL